MKSVLISIRPKWCALIASGKKTIEVRKTYPKLPTPFKCYIYCTQDKGLSFWKSKTYAYADDRSHNMFDIRGNGIHGCARLQVLEIRHDPEYIGEWIINKAARIRCYRGSKVAAYCQESGFTVEYIE